MNRNAIDAALQTLESAYRGDRFHALRRNLEDLAPSEWTARPGSHRVGVFGERPELSIRDLVHHVGGALRMYTNHAFGDATMQWGDSHGIPETREEALVWLDEAHDGFASAVAALADDSDLAVERRAPWGAHIPTWQIISTMANHEVYHSGEINRQRTLMRGAEGWERDE